MTRPITAPGRLVAGRYRLLSQIGGGGMGTVWLARDELLGRQVAVKQVLPPAGTDSGAVDQLRERALREGRIAARLSHPHAISVYDVALEAGQPWLVMEYLPSRSLAEVLSEDGVLRVDQVAQVGAQVADALAATHAAGIVHRDVKPANILIGQGGRIEGLVKITDFGISHASGDVTLTQTGQITGTPAYLSPEVAQGQEMTEASDVFSLGATLYTCLEGTPPFGMEENALRMLHRVAGGQIVPPRRAGSLTGPLLTMLAPDPEARPSMADVRDELARLAAGRDGDPTTVLMGRTDIRPAAPARARTETIVGGAGAAAAAAGVGAPAAETHGAEPAGGPPRTLGAPPPADGTEGGGRRRRSAFWMLVGAVSALLVGFIVWAVLTAGDPGTNSADPAPTTTAAPETTSAPATSDSEAPTTTPAQTTTEAPTPEPTTEPTTEPPTEPPDDDEGEDDGFDDIGEVRAKDIRNFLTGYHDQVIADPRAAFDRTGPTLRNAIGSEDAYVEYWSQFERVRIRDIEASDGQNTALGTLEWRYPDGREVSGRRIFTFLVDDGRLILDSDFQAQG